ncbi:MAG TPA: hypothetical protein VJL28_03050 [Gemmatimonadaceae bacterium]|nr:hypothetical protein [Gemmatimonadaceae bacterium]
MTTRALVVALALPAVAVPAFAQRWHTLDASRQLRDTLPVTVRVEYGAGKFELRPGAAPLLYLMHLKYDADRAEPVTRFDSAARTLALGIRSHGLRLSSSDQEGGTLHAELTARAPMALALELGAVEADLQLGGLRLTDLSLKGGAADVTVRFDERNPERLHAMTLDVGAAAVKIRRAGNSGVEQVRANVGAGALDLDLGGGDSAHDVEVSANVAMGNFTLRVPPGVGVSIDATTFLASFDKAGLVKRGDRWNTPNFDAAARKVRVRVRTVLGGFRLARDAR